MRGMSRDIPHLVSTGDDSEGTGPGYLFYVQDAGGGEKRKGENMKRLVQVKEVEGEGLLAFMGKQIILMCANYFYTGKLVGVNESCVVLADASIVYDTGAWASKDYADQQALPGPEWYVQLSSVESFGNGK